MVILKAIKFSHDLVSKTLSPGEEAIDATAGNGSDTLFLSSLVGSKGRVYAFDIQKEAINNTRQRLKESLFQNVVLINDGHEYMDKYVFNKVGAIMFNLGYLPGGDHTIITRPSSSMVAVKKALNLIKIKGIISIICYCGHGGGREERDSLISMLKDLDQNTYQVLFYSFINQINYPPELIAIEKL